MCIVNLVCNVQEAISDIVALVAKATPSNESETCEWIILPTLWRLGYDRTDIRSRISDNSGKFPDYTILPASDHTWFLEAKAFSEKLSAANVHQAIYSAFSTGRRWVVLTNGQVWRLYDAQIIGDSDRRLVAEASTQEVDKLAGLFEAICKHSICSGKTASYATSQRLYTFIQREVTDSDSELITRVAELVRERLGMDVTRQEVVKALTGQATKHSIATAQSPRVTAATPSAAPAPSTATYWIIPAKNYPNEKAIDCVKRLVGNGWWAFGPHSLAAGRVKKGDKLCFYAANLGVIAYATAATDTYQGTTSEAMISTEFSWLLKLTDASVFTREAIKITPQLRARLDAFRDKSPKDIWSWFVQSSRQISRHDFMILTGR